MQLHPLTCIDEVPADEWNALPGAEPPFLRHEFLAALEHSGCVGPATGWMPCHLTLRAEDGQLLGALPLYRKLHSFGEFVFDFAWAHAHAQTGLAYYPKLLCAVPFTPATGPRFLAASPQARAGLLEGVLESAREAQLSSFHVLFPSQTETQILTERELLLRRGCQFHWFNRGYADFDAFLARFTAEKRKKARRERRRIAEAGVHFQTLLGGEIDHTLWRRIHAFHADTFHRHGHQPYLSCAFFEEVAARLPDRVVVQLALHRARAVGAAICFRNDETLYGRYWGASENFHSLHFECCYYQGIEYCIRAGLRRFEPGTQGEHKVARGFEPTYTVSAHWIADARLRAAIDAYLQRETAALAHYADDVREHVPYKRSLAAARAAPGPEDTEE